MSLLESMIPFAEFGDRYGLREESNKSSYEYQIKAWYHIDLSIFYNMPVMCNNDLIGGMSMLDPITSFDKVGDI